VHAIVVGTITTRRTCFTFFLFVLIILESFAQAGGRVGVARRIARRTIGTARGTIGVGRFAGLGQIGIDAAFFARRFTFAVLVLAGWARRTIFTSNQIEFTQIACRTKTTSPRWCFFSFDAWRTNFLVRVTLCKANGAVGAHFKPNNTIFKRARCAIGTFGAAIFGRATWSTLVAWTFPIFVSGERIFSAKLASSGTNGIVEFALHIEQETRTTTHATKRRKKKEWLAWYSTEKHKAWYSNEKHQATNLTASKNVPEYRANKNLDRRRHCSNRLGNVGTK